MAKEVLVANKMWMVTIAVTAGPAFRALVRDSKMESAMSKARKAAEDAGVVEKEINVNNMGPWPTAIVE